MPCNTSVPGPTWARLRKRPEQVPLSLRAFTVRPGAAAGEGIPCRSRCGCRRWFRRGRRRRHRRSLAPRSCCCATFFAAARLLFAAADADLALLAIPLPLVHPATALGRCLLRLIVEFHPRDVLEVPEGEDAEGQFLVVQILDELQVGAVFEVLVRVAPEHAIQVGGRLGAETPFDRLADGGRGLRSPRSPRGVVPRSRSWAHTRIAVGLNRSRPRPRARNRRGSRGSAAPSATSLRR